MTKLEQATWWRFGIWMVVGLIVYALHSHSHSRLRRGGDPIGVDGEDGDGPEGPRFSRDPSGAVGGGDPVGHPRGTDA